MENMRKGKIDVRYYRSDCCRHNECRCTYHRDPDENEKIDIKKAANFWPSAAAF